MPLLLSLVPALRQQVNELINGKSQTIRDQELDLLFLQRHNQSQTFCIKLVKNRHKRLQRHWYLVHWIYHNYKNDDYEIIHSVNPFCLLVNHTSGHTEEKNEKKYLLFDGSVNEKKHY